MDQIRGAETGLHWMVQLGHAWRQHVPIDEQMVQLGHAWRRHVPMDEQVECRRRILIAR